MKEYLLLSGTHVTRNKDGDLRRFHAGDAVPLTDGQAELLGDRVEALKGKAKPKTSADKGQTLKVNPEDGDDEGNGS